VTSVAAGDSTQFETRRIAGDSRRVAGRGSPILSFQKWSRQALLFRFPKEPTTTHIIFADVEANALPVRASTPPWQAGYFLIIM
jgi:hypothetical protein